MNPNEIVEWLVLKELLPALIFSILNKVMRIEKAFRKAIKKLRKMDKQGLLVWLDIKWIKKKKV